MLQEDCCKKNKCCVDLIVCIITTLLAFTIGLLIGALTGILILLNLGAIIAVLAILTILLIIRIINLICCKDKKEKECNYCDYDKYC